jgi:hypothetical protein
MNPEISSEYPCGEKYWDERMEKAFTLQSQVVRYSNRREKKRQHPRSSLDAEH